MCEASGLVPNSLAQEGEALRADRTRPGLSHSKSSYFSESTVRFDRRSDQISLASVRFNRRPDQISFASVRIDPIPPVHTAGRQARTYHNRSSYSPPNLNPLIPHPSHRHHGAHHEYHHRPHERTNHFPSHCNRNPQAGPLTRDPASPLNRSAHPRHTG